MIDVDLRMILIVPMDFFEKDPFFGAVRNVESKDINSCGTLAVCKGLKRFWCSITAAWSQSFDF
jgi:hypothetical protein